MRGIERVVAGILLVAAVCGSAAFARGVGREAAIGTENVQLAAAPPQHAQSARAVQVPLYPLLLDKPSTAAADSRRAAKPSLADAPVLVSTASRVTTRPVARTAAPAPRPYTRAPVRPPVPKADEAPAPGRPRPTPQGSKPQTPKPQAPAAPAEQSDSRILAKVPLTPTPTWQHVAKGAGQGRLKNRPDDAPAAPPAPQQSSPSLTPQSSSTITLVVLPPAPASSESQGDVPGRGHAYGHLKRAVNDHD